MPHEDVGDEDDDGDDDWQGSPQVHTGCIQVLDDPESPQLSSSAGLYTGPQRLLPPEELDDTNATQQLCHELGVGTREQYKVETLLTCVLLCSVSPRLLAQDVKYSEPPYAPAGGRLELESSHLPR